MSDLTSRSKPRIGFVGVGVMGRPMASNLLKAGYPCAVFDINPAPLKALGEEGATVPGNVAELAAQSDILITMVVNDLQFLATLFEPGNAAKALKPGSLVMGMSTMSRGAVQETATRLNEMGLEYLDAPVSGGEVGAMAGTLSIMVGGPAEVVEKYRPVLEVLGTNIYQVGKKAGDGQAVKMVNQLMVSCNLVAAAEALALGEKAGLDKEMLFNIISNSAGNSWIFSNRGPRMVAGEFSPPKSALNILLKDLGFVMETANKLGHPLVMGAAAHQLYKMASAAGLGHLDDSVLIKLVEDLAGLGENNGGA